MGNGEGFFPIFVPKSLKTWKFNMTKGLRRHEDAITIALFIDVNQKIVHKRCILIHFLSWYKQNALSLQH